MASTKISNFIFSSKKRVVPYNGAFSSDLWNDSNAELLVDLSNISSQWNSSLIPLLSRLPDGTIDTGINAWALGLDGTSLWVDSRASSPSDVQFYNAAKARPYTLYEVLGNIYQSINAAADSSIAALVNGAIATANSASVTATQAYDKATEALATANAIDAKATEALANSKTVLISGLATLALVAGEQHVVVSGTSSAGDGGGGIFVKCLAASFTPDGGSIFASINPTYVWVRL